jgi:hypothetical protein
MGKRSNTSALLSEQPAAVSHSGIQLSRLLGKVQSLYARIDNLPALLDLTAQLVVDLLEEIDPRHSEATHLLGAAGLISRKEEALFRPLQLKGRPDPSELLSFTEHVGPGDLDRPTGLMGWSVANRKATLRLGRDWYVADRDDDRDRWSALRPADSGEIEGMRRADIRAYPSIQSQMAVPILDPEIRGQARPRDAIGILNIESDESLLPEFCDLMIGLGASLGHPFRTAVRMADLPRLTQRLSASVSRTSLATALLDTTLPYLPRGKRRGFVALRDSRQEDMFTIERMTTLDMGDDTLKAYRTGTLGLSNKDSLWDEAIRTARMQYLPDTSRASHQGFWQGSFSVLAIPLVAGRHGAVLGVLGLESGETSYAFSPQDQSFFLMGTQIAAVAAAAIEEARLEYLQAVRLPALLQRLKCNSLAEVPEDQIVRINSICRALVKHGFVFQKAAEECRMTVHILREHTSRSPRLIDVDALRTLAIRREEGLRSGPEPANWEG